MFVPRENSDRPINIKQKHDAYAGLLSRSSSVLLVCRPNLQVPMARASILWLMGEYCERVPKIAPDVLRKMAKTFTAEEDIVKLQTVNLAAKLYLTNSKQVSAERHLFS